MASGAPDYWASSSNAMAGLMADIKAGLLTGSDLLNKLDALDGTMDGKLDLADLNLSDVKTNLDTSITRLNTVITELGTQITNLVSINSNTSPIIRQEDKSTFQITSDDARQLAGDWASRLSIRCYIPLGNTVEIYIGHDNSVGVGSYVHLLKVGERWDETGYGGEYWGKRKTSSAVGMITYEIG